LLRSVADETKHEELAWVARMRSARVLIQQGKHDDALQLLDVEKAGAFAAQIREIRGDAQVAKGNPTAARAEYAAALAENIDGAADRMIDRNVLEMKLQDVGGDKAASTADGAATESTPPASEKPSENKAGAEGQP
jgi:predicted negative regulator of RcsB-dependent stress response